MNEWVQTAIIYIDVKVTGSEAHNSRKAPRAEETCGYLRAVAVWTVVHYRRTAWSAVSSCGQGAVPEWPLISAHVKRPPSSPSPPPPPPGAPAGGSQVPGAPGPQQEAPLLG